MRFFARAAAIACFLAFTAGADGLQEIKNTALSGTVELETTEMLKARIVYNQQGSYPVSHAWYSHLLGTLNFNARPSSGLQLLGGFEFRQYMNMAAYQFYPRVNSSYNLGDFVYNEFYTREAQGIFSLFKTESMSVDLALGLFPYKYNPEARELGEYLFRSGTYPFFLLTDFDRPFARLTGARSGFRYAADPVKANFDLIVLTERDFRPFWDISVGAIAGVDLFKMITIGAGVDFAHLIPVDSRVTTPKQSFSTYIRYSGDSLQNDTGYYTFKGTKIMARASIDPFGMLRGREGSLINEILGGQGGRIYGEVGIIGLENYPRNDNNPYGYDTLRQKMPWMAGFNIPLWKILDVCAIELERYPNPNPNSATYVILDGSPMPYFKSLKSETGYDTGSAYVPRWYWSLYMEKQIVKKFSIVCQMGRDHQRWEMPMMYQTSNYDYEDAMVKPDEWAWHIKTIFRF